MYRFSVHDYSNRLSSTSTALSNSGATVDVYRGSSLAASYNIPTEQGGTLWTVFELDGDTITPINLLSYEQPPGGAARAIGIETDAPLLRDLPDKQ